MAKIAGAHRNLAGLIQLEIRSRQLWMNFSMTDEDAIALCEDLRQSLTGSFTVEPSGDNVVVMKPIGGQSF